MLNFDIWAIYNYFSNTLHINSLSCKNLKFQTLGVAKFIPSQGRLVLNVKLLVFNVHILLFTFIWFITLCFKRYRWRHLFLLLGLHLRHFHRGISLLFTRSNLVSHHFVLFCATVVEPVVVFSSAILYILLDCQHVLLTVSPVHLACVLRMRLRTCLPLNLPLLLALLPRV